MALDGTGSEEALLPAERLEGMIAAYYQARGWDEDGMVPERLLRELGLADLSACEEVTS
jgi:aldehyde:ferredoxin oxidoreductase